MGISANSTTQYLTSSNITGHSITPVLGTMIENESIRLVYDNSSLQIRSLAMDLCLDDGGYEVLGGQNSSAVVTFQPCDSQSPNQQFILNSQRQILNPNWPNNNICLSGNGNQYAGYNQLILWEIGLVGASGIFEVTPLLCPSTIYLILRSLDSQFDVGGYYLGGSNNSTCIACPSGDLGFSDFKSLTRLQQEHTLLSPTLSPRRRALHVLPVR